MERTGPRLGPEEAQAVLRRASELDREHVAATPASILAGSEPRIDALELERIAAESGLSVEAVRRALAELRGGALGERPPPRGLERLVAGESAAARRTVDAPAEVVEPRLGTVLRASGLQPVRRGPHATRWEPSGRLGHSLARLADRGGTGAYIGAAVESSTHAAPGGQTAVELRGDVGNVLAPIATVTGLALALPAGIALLIVLALGVRWGFSGQHGLAALLVVAAWMLLTTLISRGVAKGRVRKLRRKLERTLDELEPIAAH